MQQVVPRQESYNQSRATALHSVESTITELSGIFTHLATMVAHQGELAIRFESSDLIALMHVLSYSRLFTYSTMSISFKFVKLEMAGLMTVWMSHWRMLKELTVLY